MGVANAMAAVPKKRWESFIRARAITNTRTASTHAPLKGEDEVAMPAEEDACQQESQAQTAGFVD